MNWGRVLCLPVVWPAGLDPTKNIPKEVGHRERRSLAELSELCRKLLRERVIANSVGDGVVVTRRNHLSDPIAFTRRSSRSVAAI
jgi:hypothetical protein